jgi:L-ascorbate metabolism protein UlaG (beta-lactamase superfamily)
MKMLNFEWYGQACFKIENSSVLVTDPHNGEAVGLNPPPAGVADLVTISHGHHDHASGKNLVSREGSVIIEEPGSYVEKGIKLTGIDSYHDKDKGEKRGENVIFVFEVDGVRICHLGDLGHLPGERHIENIGSVDVLLIPVGGNYTIDGKEAVKTIEHLNPQVVIPMHYKIEGLTVDISGPEGFLSDIGPEYKIREMEKLELDEIPDGKQVVKLDCLAS